VPKLCVLLYSVVLSCVAACLVCHCSKLRFVNLMSIKAYYLNLGLLVGNAMQIVGLH